MSRAASILASLLLTTIAAPGCAMLAVPALGSAAASGSAGALTRAGASAMKGGTVYRTFDAPLRDVYDAVQRTLARLEFPSPEEQVKPHVGARGAAVDMQPGTGSFQGHAAEGSVDAGDRLGFFQEHVTLQTNGIERRVHIDLQPITPTLVQVGVTVAINFFQKDPATAATLVDLVAEALGP
jgi:hypothetical protein